jgi:murein DD-endopeptidase MepM/ murein hydrolase activator NlpD
MTGTVITLRDGRRAVSYPDGRVYVKGPSGKWELQPDAQHAPGGKSSGRSSGQYHFPILGWQGQIRPHWKKYGGGTPHAWDGPAIWGTPVVAVTSGTIIQTRHGQRKAGTSIHLRGNDGRYYYYCHLAKLAPGIRPGKEVAAGEVIAAVGATGNADSPHLHFCISTRQTANGGGDINCISLLRFWLNNSNARRWAA